MLVGQGSQYATKLLLQLVPLLYPPTIVTTVITTASTTRTLTLGLVEAPAGAGGTGGCATLPGTPCSRSGRSQKPWASVKI